MVEISRAALFGKLNKFAYRAIDSATVFCKLRGNPNVELAHWIHQMLQPQDSDLHRILRQYACDPGAHRRRDHRGARAPAARRHRGRPVVERRRGGGTRLGLRHADVR